MPLEDHRLYRAFHELIDREAKAVPNGMSGEQIAQILIALLAQVINAAPDQNYRAAMTHSALDDLIRRVAMNIPADDDEPDPKQKLN
jgi:hypothetical protein